MIIARPDEDLRNADWLHGKQDLAETIADVRQAVRSQDERHAMFYHLLHPENLVGRPIGHSIGRGELHDHLGPIQPVAGPPESVTENQLRVKQYAHTAIKAAGSTPAKFEKSGLSPHGLWSLEVDDASTSGLGTRDKLSVDGQLYQMSGEHMARLGEPSPTSPELDKYTHAGNLVEWDGGGAQTLHGTMVQAAAIHHYGMPQTGNPDEKSNWEFHANPGADDPWLQTQSAGERDQALLSLEASRRAAQEHYATTGEQAVRLYRGVFFEDGVDIPPEFESLYGHDSHDAADWPTIETETNPVSSWTIDQHMARLFARNGYGMAGSSTDGQGFLLAADVPVERIVGNGIRGYGRPSQGEHVVLGGKMRVSGTEVEP